MTTAQGVLDGLVGHGYGLVTGVPCSYFAAPLRLLEQGAGPRYVAAVNEGSALAMAAGAQLGGLRPMVLAQNSGFGNLINPLTSLVLPYRIPMTVMISMRGWPTADAGEPQHQWMGRLVESWLDSLELSHWMLTPDGTPLDEALTRADAVLDAGEPAFILVAKGAITDDPPSERSASGPAVAAEEIGAGPGMGAAGPTRDEVVAAVLAEAGDAHVLSTTGYMSRSLYDLGDRDQSFYMQGSMGHVSGLALGAALAQPEHRFIVLDGDGAVLMHLGALATVGDLAPPNLTHVVFDNGVYDSTGGQRTGHRTDFTGVARACGYRDAWSVGTIDALRSALRSALATAGPAVIVVKGVPGGATGSRASSGLGLPELSDRFRRSLSAGGPR